MNTEEEILFTQKEIKDRLFRFREENFNPSWKLIAEGAGLSYTYVINYKNGQRRIGQDALHQLNDFLENHGY